MNKKTKKKFKKKIFLKISINNQRIQKKKSKNVWTKPLNKILIKKKQIQIKFKAQQDHQEIKNKVLIKIYKIKININISYSSQTNIRG